MSTLPNSINGVIFDLDGTLVSSSLDFQAIRAELNCPDELDLLSFISQITDNEQRRQANNIVLRHEQQDAENACWIDGAKEFVAHLKSQNIPMAIVTRNNSLAAQTKIHNNGIAIDLVLTREDAPAKPDPTALLTVAAKWGLETEEVAYIGDYLYDIQAANNANMFSVLLSPNAPPCYASQADMVFTAFQQLYRR